LRRELLQVADERLGIQVVDRTDADRRVHGVPPSRHLRLHVGIVGPVSGFSKVSEIRRHCPTIQPLSTTSYNMEAQKPASRVADATRLAGRFSLPVNFTPAGTCR